MAPGLASLPPTGERLAAAADEVTVWGQRPAVIGNANTSLAYVTHGALLRDLQNLINACLAGRIWTSAAATTLATFTRQLLIFLEAERDLLWPELRRTLSASGPMPDLDELASRHAQLEHLVAAIDISYAMRAITAVYDQLLDLAASVGEQVRHEESRVLPLVAHHLPVTSWDAFVARVRGLQGRAGAAGYFPWLLDAATPSTEQMLLGLLPAPIRALHHLVWSPRYRRTHLAAARRPPAIAHRRRRGRA